MIHKDFQGLQLSALGFGTMRLPTKGEGFGIGAYGESEVINKYVFTGDTNLFA